MKALKGLLIYIGIALGIILGIGIILFAIMYFVPSFRICGIGVVHTDKGSNLQTISLANYSGYSDIELNLNSKDLAVNLTTNDTDNEIKYKLKLSVFGIVTDMTQYEVIENVEVKNNVLKINLNVTEPNGLISDTSSELTVSVPSSQIYNLIANTKGGDILINGNGKLNLDKLNVTTTKGNASIVKIGQIIGESCSEILDSLNLSTDTGYFNLSTINNLTVNNTIKLYAKDGDFVFNNLNAGLDVAGTGVKLTAKTIKTDSKGFKFVSENGFFDIGLLDTPLGAENTIVTDNCDVKIAEVKGKTAIVTTYGNITVGILNHDAILESKHGNVNINIAKEDIKILTDFGNITVNSYFGNAKFISRKGNIKAKNNGEYKNGVYTQIENQDGSIEIDNKINKLIVITTGTSKASITYREIKGGMDNPGDVFQHKVNIGPKSSATVYMPTANYNTPFKFLAKGNISGEISGLISDYEGDEVKSSEDYQYFPSASADSQAQCQKSCYFEFLGTIRFKSYINN